MPTTININKASEGVDYQLIPVDVENDQAWDIRILRGEFVETVLRYGAIKFDGEKDALTFSFIVVESPDEVLSSDNEELQIFAGDILEDVLEKAVSEGWLVTPDNLEEDSDE